MLSKTICVCGDGSGGEVETADGGVGVGVRRAATTSSEASSLHRAAVCG